MLYGPTFYGADEIKTVKKPVQFGKYFLLERINVGGMAEVFRAKAFGVEGFERLVAVKRILPNIAEDKEFIRMFVDEAKISVQLNHANIAQIFDLGVVDTSYYIALEHIHGRDVRAVFDRCRQNGEAMPVAQACFIVMKLCEGLDYAHNKRDQGGRELHLVHRDVSPQNILVSFEGEVKVIDFGIAKAADKQNKTQAGILKGKFGYMSPEQVRGMSIDRRSDVFACGIVLYELLTGERLFVGESDFSTLEKVRNVEILPPSTYNRKIPDELERIVLKALAKDVDERYQNAIDLHDELQAFVYTAGEFYSRKDLAGWMKKTFGKEIDEEAARIESFRQLKPPAPEAPPTLPPGPAVARAATGSKPPPPTPAARRTLAGMNAVAPAAPSGTRPPPTPGSAAAAASRPNIPSPPVKAEAVNPIDEDLVDTGDHEGTTRVDGASEVLAKAEVKRRTGGAPGEDLSWDDEELETQIYDNPDDDPRSKQRVSKPLQAQVAPGPAAAVAAAAAIGNPSAAPDLSSLAATAKGWPATAKGGATLPANSSAAGNAAVGSSVPSPGSTLNGAGPIAAAMPAVGRVPTGPGTRATGPLAAAAPNAATPLHGSNGHEALGLASTEMSAPALNVPTAFATGNESSAAVRLGSAEQSAFGQSMIARNARGGNSKTAIAMVAGAAVLGGLVVYFVTRPSDNKPADSTGAGSQVAIVVTTPDAAPSVATDEKTGFDLFVRPGNVASWRLDGEARTDKLPLAIRRIAPGEHTVSIDAPPGFMSESQKVTVVAGQAQKVVIELKAMEITGVFESDPPGATVSLIVDGKRTSLGLSPAKATLDPQKAYQVLFEKTGYISFNRPVSLAGGVEERVTVKLEKAGVANNSNTPIVPISRPDKLPIKDPIKDPVKDPIKDPVKDPVKDPIKDPVAVGDGTMSIGSKPPCDIFIDGKPTGQKTPTRDIKMSAGKHKITLVNNEFSIKESFIVDVKEGPNKAVVKDYSDKIVQP